MFLPLLLPFRFPPSLTSTSPLLSLFCSLPHPQQLVLIHILLLIRLCNLRLRPRGRHDLRRAIILHEVLDAGFVQARQVDETLHALCKREDAVFSDGGEGGLVVTLEEMGAFGVETLCYGLDLLDRVLV